MEALQHIPVYVNKPPIIPEFLNFKNDIQDLPPLGKEEIEPQSEAGKVVSEEQYWEKYYEHPDFSYEWNNGILEVKAVGDFASYLQSEFFSEILKEYIKTTKMARVIGLDIGFRLELPNKTSIRKPDLAVILNSNPVQIELEHRTYKGCYDMCIEFLSDADKKGLENDTIVKKSEYCKAGVKEYFILDRKKNETAFYRLTSKGTYRKLKPQSGIIKSHVLPGFNFRVQDLYSQPTLEELLKDKVYQPYVLKRYQEQVQKAEKEHSRAEIAEKALQAERLKAEKAEKKAKRLAEQLQAFLEMKTEKNLQKM